MNLRADGMNLEVHQRWQICLWVVVCLFVFTEMRGQTDPSRFEADIVAFEERDQEAFPAKGGALFVGSSSIRKWTTLEADFAGYPVVNRGFGGAQFSDVMYFFDRVVLVYEPRVIFIYAGSHDLRRSDGGPKAVLEKFIEFESRVHAVLPNCLVCFISMKPSIQKWDTIGLDREANRLVRNYTDSTTGTAYVDIWTPMIEEGEPPPEHFFLPDLNHPSEEGYRVWAEAIRPVLEEVFCR
ncbi:GDSL-type esterase/lipase family protein [Pelagicoccus mobilis]|uniref:SGNH hydrolase-type esterase domain-containing protein n=1 Tax=Pelagicoccus mobilis TaxID=415221 RepID=A0A934RYD8_9BACT|nr:GDSL-type esterase/lipase family protein [Pelagicoccus mobilis]MBK1876129.1 hypothetical protein [Pelagicoccus mobilis]